MKRIILILILFIVGCRKLDVVPQPETNKNIFEQNSAVIENGQDIEFKLETDGKYFLVLFDSTANKVISREKFIGTSGNNVKKIYTNSFNQKSLYLYLVTENNQQVKKTLITVKWKNYYYFWR